MLLNIIIIINFASLAMLVFCVIYLTFSYRKLLEKNQKLSVKEVKEELHDKINTQAKNFVNKKMDKAIDEATRQAVDLISKNAKNVANSIRQKTVKELSEEKEGEEQAVEAEYDEAKIEIEKYKAAEYEKIRQKASEVLVKVTNQVLPQVLDREKEEELIIKALEDAKQSNIL